MVGQRILVCSWIAFGHVLFYTHCCLFYFSVLSSLSFSLMSSPAFLPTYSSSMMPSFPYSPLPATLFFGFLPQVSLSPSRPHIFLFFPLREKLAVVPAWEAGVWIGCGNVPDGKLDLVQCESPLNLSISIRFLA